METGFQFLQIDWLIEFLSSWQRWPDTFLLSEDVWKEKSLCHWPEIQTDWSIKESTASEIHNHYIHVSPNPSHEALLIRGVPDRLCNNPGAVEREREREARPSQRWHLHKRAHKNMNIPKHAQIQQQTHSIVCNAHTHSHGYIKVRKHDLSAHSLDYGRWCAFLTRWGEHDRSGVKLGKCTLVKKLFKLITSSLRLPNCMMHEYSYT